MKSIAEKLKQIREERGLSQRALAHLAGVSNTDISDIERGERKGFAPGLLRKIAGALNVRASTLLVAAGYLPEEEVACGRTGEMAELLVREFPGLQNVFEALNEMPDKDVESVIQFVNFIYVQNAVKDEAKKESQGGKVAVIGDTSSKDSMAG